MAKSKRNNFRRKSRKMKYKKNNKKYRTSKKRVPAKSNKHRGGMSGIELNDVTIEPNKAYELFLNNSKLTYLSKGSFGTTFIATLDDVNMSPYKSTDATTYGKPVSTIIIKIAMLEEPYDENLTNFNNEINIQKEIYFKTMEYLEPICPAIVYSNVYIKKKEKRITLNQIAERIEKYDTRSINELSEFIDYKYGIGIIAMEFAKGYNTLSSLRNNPNYKLYKEMIMFLLLELALKTGYSHADFHEGNLMINTTSSIYFIKTDLNEPRILGKPLLIDFGLTNKIPPEIMILIKEYYDREDYTKALHYLCQVERSDELEPKEYPDYYGWVCGSVDPNMSMVEIQKEIAGRVKQKLLENPYKKKDELKDEVLNEMSDISNMRFAPNTNDMIKLLIRQRKKAIQQLVPTFNKLHIGEVQLPLTEESKETIIEEIKTPKTPNSLNISSDRSSPVDLDFLDNVSFNSNQSSSEGIFAMSPY